MDTKLVEEVTVLKETIKKILDILECHSEVIKKLDKQVEDMSKELSNCKKYRTYNKDDDDISIR